MIIEEIGQLPGNFPKLYNPMKYVSSSVEDFGIPMWMAVAKGSPEVQRALRAHGFDPHNATEAQIQSAINLTKINKIKHHGFWKLIPQKHTPEKLIGNREIIILKSLLNKVNARLDRIEKMLKIQ